MPSLFLLFFLFLSVCSFGQNMDPPVERSQLPYPAIREGDVLWSKTVWRDIDVLEHPNLCFYKPVEPIGGFRSLFDIIVKAYRQELIVPFSGQVKFGKGEFDEALGVGYCDTNCFGRKFLDEYDSEDGNIIGMVEKYYQFQSFDVVAYRLKEYWYFDKQRGRLMVNIMGIMPVVEIEDEKTGDLVRQTTAWFYFPELRPVLQREFVYAPGDTTKMTFDELFMQRRFSSIIVKGGNVFGRDVEQSGKKGYDLYLESERMKEEVFNGEHDLWDY